MKIRDILLPASFAILCTYFVQSLVNYFATKNSPENSAALQPGQRSFVAPKQEQLIKPLQTEVDFLDKDIACQGNEHTVTTERLIARYASCGAVISQLTSKRFPGVEEKELTFLDIAQPGEREKGAFLVALQDKTPLSYELVSEKAEQNVHTVLWRAKTDACTVEKEFKFFNNSYKVDLAVTIEPHKPEGVQPRIFVTSPSLKIVGAQDAVQGLVMGDTNVLEKKDLKAMESGLWIDQTLFGTENRYFIMALVADDANFVQRAYYKIVGVNQVASILEGPLVQKKTSWNLSFYCGPKQLNAMNEVDSRLQATLDFDYGWLAPISKLAMKVLNFIYRYVHNYGWAIILLTLLIKIVLVPFSMRAEKSAKKAAEMKKKLQYIEQKFKHDPEALAREKTELIKKNGMFDLGCLSIFVQIPILLALQKALSSSIELYQAPFVGWIHDLSAIDPYYVFPALVGLGIFIHSSSAGDARQRLVTIMMALIVGALMMNFAVGLVLFICASTWLSIVQTRLQKAFKI